jgi:hypothetical protein
MNWSVNRLVALLALFVWLLPGISVASDTEFSSDSDCEIELVADYWRGDGTYIGQKVIYPGITFREWRHPVPGDPQSILRRVDAIQRRKTRREKLLFCFKLLIISIMCFILKFRYSWNGA